MAEHLLIPKRLARRLPWLKRAAWHIEAWFVRAVIGSLRLFAPERASAIAMAVMRCVGPLLPMWDKVGRNLAIAFPALPVAERRRLRRGIFAHLGAAIAELVLSDRIWAERERRLEFIADPAIRGLHEGGRPMVLVTAHVGAWQLANLVGAHFRLPITSLYAAESNPFLADMVLQLRERLKVRWIPSTGGIRSLITELRSGHSVGLACDTRLDQGEAVPYFGHPAMTNTVPARLALKQDCELVPVRVERLGAGRYRVSMHAPIVPRDTTAPQAEQALDMSTRLNALFEQWIRETPDEWMCLARRFPKELDKAARG
jgi:KDO2-lipid IV(A) lauroyltransferase